MTGFSLYRRKKRKYKNRRAHCETAYDKARTKALSKNNWFAAIKRINEADRAPAHPTPKPFTIVVTITIEATT